MQDRIQSNTYGCFVMDGRPRPKPRSHRASTRFDASN